MESFEIAFDGIINDVIHRAADRIYFSTRKGIIYCVNGKKRELEWKYQADQSIMSPVYPGKDKIFVFDSLSTLYCLDYEGYLVWKIKIPEKITSGIGEGPDSIYLGTEKGTIFSLDKKNGNIIWNFSTGGAIRTIPVLWRNQIIVGSDDHKLHFLNNSGALLFDFETGDKIRGGLLVDGANLYFGSYDHIFYGFDLQKRKISWKMKTGGKIHSYPVSDEKRVYFISMNNVLYCLEKKTGTTRWWKSISSRSFYRPELFGDCLVVSNLSSHLLGFEVKTGKEMGRYDINYELRSNPIWMKPFLIASIFHIPEQRGKLIFLGKEVKATLASSKKSPIEVDEEVVFKVAVSGFFQPEYEFYLSRVFQICFGFSSFILVQSEKQIVQNKSRQISWTWFPEKHGVYVISIQVTDKKEKAKTEMSILIAENN